MERAASDVLTRQSAGLDHYPEMQAMVRRHLEETGAQIERLNDCLETLGESGPTAAAGNILSDALDASAQSDILRSTFASYALENYEIATYQSLLDLAQLAGRREIEPYLKASLAEEEAFAKWIGHNIARLTRDYVSQMERREPSG